MQMLIRQSRREFAVWLGSVPVAWSAGRGLPETDATAEGPAYKAGAPFKDDLVEARLGGTPLVLSGIVYSTTGERLQNATLDFWEANMDGIYDQTGYTLRGKVRTDGQGLYRVRLLVPKAYRTSPTSDSYRTAHIHVKASADAHAMVTTELYVQGDPRNYSDSGPRPSLQLALQPARGGQTASFEFVVRHV